MMKKSSLGRRSSVMSTGRLSVADKNVSRLNDGKKSLIPKPLTFGNKPGRSSSIERDFNVSTFKRDPPSTLQRSKSYLNIDIQRTSTPCYTPQHSRNTGSVYGRLQLSEGGSRTSSVGGLKSAKKDSRPVAEKSFQNASQQKIQEFFLTRAPEYLEKGSIKPMNAAMFADLVNFLIAKFDKTITVNRLNPIDGVLAICKVLNYRGKAEKSWLRTVNTPHSWPHVVSFLVWLVELYEVSDALNVYEAMYPERVEGDAELNDLDFKTLVPHLITGYNQIRNNQPDTDELRQFLIKHKQVSNVDEGEIELRKQEYAQLQEELNNSEDAADEAQLQERKAIAEALKKDIKKTREFNYETESYINNMNEKHVAKMALFNDYEKKITLLREEKVKLEEFVAQQEMSQDQKKEIETTLAMLLREIQQLNETIEEYKNECYKEDLKLVNVKGAFNKMVQDYNRELIVNLALIPELKSAEIEDIKKVLGDSPDANQPFQNIDDKLAELKTYFKTSRQELEGNIEKTKMLLQENEDQLMHKQDELANLKNECNKYEKELAELRKSFRNDKEQAKRVLDEMQVNIELEKKRLQLEQGEEKNELNALQEKKESTQKAHVEFVKQSGELLMNRLQSLKDAKAKLEEITKQRMAEREKRIEEILKT